MWSNAKHGAMGWGRRCSKAILLQRLVALGILSTGVLSFMTRLHRIFIQVAWFKKIRESMVYMYPSRKEAWGRRHICWRLQYMQPTILECWGSLITCDNDVYSTCFKPQHVVLTPTFLRVEISHLLLFNTGDPATSQSKPPRTLVMTTLKNNL